MGQKRSENAIFTANGREMRSVDEYLSEAYAVAYKAHYYAMREGKRRRGEFSIGKSGFP